MRTFGIQHLLLLSALPVLALDEKPLVAPSAMEFGFRFGGDVTYQLADKDWNQSSATTPSAPVEYSSDFVFKYGMNPSSDLEVTLPWVFRDKDYALSEGKQSSYAGFDRMTLAAKIKLGKTGAGLVAGFAFPLGHEKVVGFNPEWGFTMGAFGGYRKGPLWVDGLTTWSTTPKNSAGFQPGDVTFLSSRAGIQLEEGVAPNLGLSYGYTGRSATKGVASGAAVHKIVATPGCLLQFDEEWTLDVRVPVVVAAANSHASAGLSLGIVGFFGD